MKQIPLLFLIFLFPFLNSAKIQTSIPEISLNDTLLNLPGIKAFEGDEVWDVSLEFDVWSFIKTKKDEEYFDTVFKLYLNNGDTITRNIRLKSRGNFRRDNCFFPPIRLNFKNDSIPNSGLNGKVKLVTHCTGTKKSEKFVTREYLAYKMFNVLSDTSYKVRFLNIRYIDTGPRKKNYNGVGFLIEPLESLAKRTETEIIEENLVSKKNLFDKEADVLALFQYMIGNTDWKIKGGHNMKYLKPDDLPGLKVVPVPYDFDFSGFVGTSYSIPQDFTTLTNVFDREYLGYCRNDDDSYLKAIQTFEVKKSKILNVIEGCQIISKKERKYLSAYLNEFFKAIEEPEVFMRTLKRECRIDF